MLLALRHEVCDLPRPICLKQPAQAKALKVTNGDSLPGVLSDGWTVQHPAGPVCAVRGSALIIPLCIRVPQPGPALPRTFGHVVPEPEPLHYSQVRVSQRGYPSGARLPGPGGVPGGQGEQTAPLKSNDLRVSDGGTYVFRFITDHPVTRNYPARPASTCWSLVRPWDFLKAILIYLEV